MPLSTEDLKQAADDIFEQAQMLHESVHSADETQAWYIAKIAELRKYLDRAESALSVVDSASVPGMTVFDRSPNPKMLMDLAADGVPFSFVDGKSYD